MKIQKQFSNKPFLEGGIGMIKFDGEILLTTDEFAEKIGTGVKTARAIMSEREGNFVVTVGKRQYVCWQRYQLFVLSQMKEGINYE